MKFLFSHREFPAHFEHLVIELAKNPKNEVVFITEARNNLQIKGVKKIEYKLKRQPTKNCHSYLKSYEEAIIHGQAAAESAIILKRQGFIPNVIYAHPNGNSMFFKDVFPNVPLIIFCEWYYNSKDSDVDFGGKILNEDSLAKNRCKNAQLLIDLESCDKAICPTQWQKAQFPKIFHSKIKILHNGIDADYFLPSKKANFKTSQGITLSTKDKVITYHSRGFDEYGGFAQFMIMLERLFKKRCDFKVLISGEDKIRYGTPLTNTTYKKAMLEKLNLDVSKIHFVGRLTCEEYKKFLQISSVHIHLTYPFIPSWSMLEAMSCGCLVVGSKTAPVEEIIKDNYNGLLVDFFNTDELANKVEYALNNQKNLEDIRKNARKTILEKYDLKTMLPKILNTLDKVAKK